jgi:hypothetical protein
MLDRAVVGLCTPAVLYEVVKDAALRSHTSDVCVLPMFNSFIFRLKHVCADSADMTPNAESAQRRE